MKLRTREEILSIINTCALKYKENLCNKALLFVAANKNVSVHFEALFLPQNFKHLTGVKSKLSGTDFFNLAVKNRISVKDIEPASDGTTDLKLDVLFQLMNIHYTARMIGDYDHTKSLLVTDKIAGTVTAAMGFTMSSNGMYLPNTALKKDVRDITTKATRHRVIAIFAKPRGNNMCDSLTYLAKGITIDDAILAKIMKEKVRLLA